MSARRPIVGGNWKMHTDLAGACELADDIVAGTIDLVRGCDVAIFPPFPYLQAVGHTLGNHGVVLGAQDVYPETSGAYTGEVGLDMLMDLGVSMVLVGHSERRHVIGEDDELIARKLQAAVEAGLNVVLCVGETLDQRDDDRTEAVVVGQLLAALAGVSPRRMRRVIIAYEPVWAIGTGRTASPDDAQAVHAVIRAELASRYDESIANSARIQYGGSVKPNNAAALFAQPDIDGGLIGGASLKADDFLAIIRAAAEAAAVNG